MQYNLDQFQLKAVFSNSRNTLVVAAPGSGKTMVILNRIIYLINELNVNPNNIIVITFTRAAAENMKNRYLNINKNKGIPYFGTMHSLFYRMLKDYNHNIKIVDEFEVYNLINNILLTYLDEISEEKVKETINNISVFKNSSKSIDEFQSSIDKMIFVQCFKEYEEYKNKNSLIDFDDLQLKCKNILEEDKDILKYYRNRFKYILVDEFQDCDDLQIQILKLLNLGSSIFAVGDEDQSIYGFRGSNPQYMTDFEKNFPDASVYFLNMNYRCPENIVSISDKLIRNNLNRNLKKIRAYKEYSKEISIITCKDEEEEANCISRIIKGLRYKNETNFNETAIIYRTNRECSRLIDEFIKEEIPFRFIDKEYNIYDHFICKDLIAYFKFSYDDSDKESFLRIINKPFRYISKLDLQKIKRVNIKENLFDVLCSFENISLHKLKELQKLKKQIIKIKDYTPVHAIKYINEELSYHKYVENYCLENKINIKVIDTIIENITASGSAFHSTIDFLKHIDKVNKELSDKIKNEKCIILSTIHGVKGMEFKNLFIINCNNDNIPYLKENYVNLEEERRLFYVAITRTIENLWIFYSNYFNGVKKEPSPFLMECGFIDK